MLGVEEVQHGLFSKQQTRTYLAIYESFYSPDVKGTKHRSIKNLGNINKLIEAGIDDPVSFYQKEVDRMNAEKKMEKEVQKKTEKLMLYLNVRHKQTSDV